ncbi:peptidase [Streptomyces sp. NPDC048142]|uniref:peptidase n=1 Tax=Streptomyces sp. NPDC048142 TaxID=3365501 RepID=UPI003720E81C
MTRISPRPVLRRAAGSLAAAGLLAAATLAGAAAPAQADDAPVFTLGGPAETALHPYPESGEPQHSTVGISVNNPSQDDEDGGYGGHFTLTFDLSGVDGVADVAFDGESTSADCRITGTKAVCEDWGIWPGNQGAADLTVTAAEGSEDGDTGTIKVTGEAEGVTFTPFTTRLTVGGPDLVMEQLPFDQELNPGDKQQAPITFMNRGSRDADGVLLTLLYSRGLDIPQRYTNCEYTVDDPADQGIGFTTALCSVEGSFEAGETYTLATPLTIEATTRAFYDTFVYRIHEDGAAQRAAQRAGATFERGDGSVLKAVPAKKKSAVARGADLNPYDNQQEVDFRTKNTADFVAYGDEASGAAGTTVKADIGFRNEGPAWIGYIRSGEDVATVDFTVPQGASVTAKPDRCRAVTAEGKYREDQKSPAPRYVCYTSMTVRDGAGLDLPFELRIDKALIGASGEVTVRNTWLQDPELPFDPKPANNTAYLILNGEGGGADSGGTTGSDGGSGDPSTPPTSSPDPQESPSATPGTSTSTTSGGGSAGTTGGSGGGGGLASTGSIALIASGTAAAALAAGLLLFTAARRRAAAQHG